LLYATEPRLIGLRSFIKLCQGVLRSSSILIIINHKRQARAAAFIERPIHLRLVDVDPGRMELLSTLLFYYQRLCAVKDLLNIDARAINYTSRHKCLHKKIKRSKEEDNKIRYYISCCISRIALNDGLSATPSK